MAVGHDTGGVSFSKISGTGSRQMAIWRRLPTDGINNVLLALTAYQNGEGDIWQIQDELIVEYRPNSTSAWIPVITDRQQWNGVQDLAGEGITNAPSNLAPTTTAYLQMPAAAANNPTLDVRIRGVLNGTTEKYRLYAFEVLNGDVTTPSGPIFSDDFSLPSANSGSSGRTGSTSAWTIDLVSGSAAQVGHSSDGTGSAVIGKVSGTGVRSAAIFRTVDTTGHSSVYLTLTAFQSGTGTPWQLQDYLTVQYRLSPTDAWTNLLTDVQVWNGMNDSAGEGVSNAAGNGTPTATASLALPAGAGNNANLQIRLLAGTNGTSEKFHLDRVTISPTP